MKKKHINKHRDTLFEELRSGTAKIPKIMGIVNVTPDSFYDGGKYSNTVESAIQHALELIEQGADIIDIGGESSRPGAIPVSVSQEIDRIQPVIEGVRKFSKKTISIDTTKAKVVKFALEAGANWLNDISAMSFDEKMIDVVSDYDCPVVIMHMQGTPLTMQKNPVYNDVVIDIYSFFESKINELNEHGIKKILVDPGIGFGKTINHNLEIINKVKIFKKLKLPLVLGASRKSFIGNILKNDVEDRLAGSLAVFSWLSLNQVDVIRVHDVKESAEFRTMIEAIQEAEFVQNKINITV